MTLLGFAALRAGAHPLGMALDPAQSFLALNVVAAVAVGGFFVEFLRLRHDSPQLYRLVVAVLGLESAIGLAFALTPALAPKLDDLNLVLNVIGTTLLIVVALIRGLAGYRPAYYLLAGLSGLMLANWYLALRDFYTFSTPLFDRWAFEAGTATDAILFSIAIAYRMRYDLQQSARIKRELQRATFAAEHDNLTGLANRRGLERWLDVALPRERTVFYIDLDHFKSVNDRGGHDAGDRTLVAVAGILGRLIRATDIAARLGGDEFVLVIASVAADRITALTTEIETNVAALRPLGEADPTRIGASIGTAPLKGAEGFALALQQADEAAYVAKRDHHRERLAEDASADQTAATPDDGANSARAASLVTASTSASDLPTSVATERNVSLMNAGSLRLPR
jgi:diguanylate cyclase (GGDEF)-like protein